MLGKTEHIHFVGIGGIGMSGLALVMRNLGLTVSGSDAQRSEITESLKGKEIRVYYGHRASHVRGADVVVFSTAIKPDNPELAEARRCSLPVIHRGELLAELSRLKIAVCISGTHGKTTTTSLVGEVLDKGGLSPTVVVGGIVKGKSQATYGKGKFLVCEADESDKSFLRLYPAYAVITNIEAEHLDHYKDIEEIKEHFAYFANHVPFWGCTFLCADSSGAMAIRQRIHRRTITYGFHENAEMMAEDIEQHKHTCTFTVRYRDARVGRFTVPVLGKHNVNNTMAAIAVGLELGISPAKIKNALRAFSGVRRRIEYLGDIKGIALFDDYGHHPTEIAVTLQTIRDRHPNRRIISVFQPHRYTRTYHLLNDFGRAFLYADIVIVSEIYAAHEVPIPGVSGLALARRIQKEHDAVHFIAGLEDIMVFLKKVAKRGDVIVVQGAGDINRLPKMIIKEFS